MRDVLCNAEELKETIDFNKEEIAEEKEEIKLLYDDINKGIQRYPRKNEEIIYETKGRLFRLLYELIRAKYSLGMECVSIEQDYLDLISVVADIGYKKIGYVHFIQVFALGILLEVTNSKLEQLIEIADKENLDDCLFDFLVHSCGLERKFASENYQKEKPYKETALIINLSYENKAAAVKELKNYMEKKWFQGHYDYEWENAHKRVGYVGFWSFETAALVKILQLDDSKLQDNIHYPYDLMHYKKGRTFSTEHMQTVNKDKDDIKKSDFSEKSELGQIIPQAFHELINKIIADYAHLENKDFWTKYKLEDVWFTIDEFSLAKSDRNLLGEIIINVLVDKGYILQLDYKENVEDHINEIKNFWKEKQVILVHFELNNDQNYYAIIPRKAHLRKLYDVAIIEDKTLV